MALFAAYLCPVFSNWNQSTINGGTWKYEGDSFSPFYIKLAACFGAMGLYLWTILAPKVLKGRNFD